METTAVTSGISGQIIKLYEQEEGNITIPELVGLFENRFSETAIKMVLMQGSELYRKLDAEGKSGAFNDDDLARSKAVLRGFMDMVNVEPHLAFRSAKLIFDEKTGKRGQKNVVQNINVTVQTIHNQLAEAERAEQIAKTKAINIPDQYKELQSIDV